MPVTTEPAAQPRPDRRGRLLNDLDAYCADYYRRGATPAERRDRWTECDHLFELAKRIVALEVPPEAEEALIEALDMPDDAQCVLLAAIAIHADRGV